MERLLKQVELDRLLREAKSAFDFKVGHVDLLMVLRERRLDNALVEGLKPRVEEVDPLQQLNGQETIDARMLIDRFEAAENFWKKELGGKERVKEEVRKITGKT